MIVLIFISIVMIVFGVVSIMLNTESGGPPIISMFSLVTIVCFIGLLAAALHIEDRRKENLKVDLPEEIFLARERDTLYINKRTKDSIYLGFRQKQ